MTEQETKPPVVTTSSSNDEATEELKRNLAAITDGIANLKKSLFQAGSDARRDAAEFDPDHQSNP